MARNAWRHRGPARVPTVAAQATASNDGQSQGGSTGALNASSAYTYGPEIGLRWKNFLLQGEYVRIGVDRANSLNSPAASVPALEFDGGYVEGSWVITGEPRSYNTSEAAFGSPKVKRPLLHQMPRLNL